MALNGNTSTKQVDKLYLSKLWHGWPFIRRLEL